MQKIDIGSILKQRLKWRARLVPQFVVRWLEQFIHQDFLNTYIEKGHSGVAFCTEGMKYLDVTLHITGRENLPSDGRRYTFVSNHPLGGIDGVALGAILGSHYNGKIKYLVNDLLLHFEGLAPLCVPVNKTGKQARNASKAISQAFESDNHIIMFPAGLCSRRQKDGTIRDLPWSKSFLKRSIHSQRDIVPIHFVGQNSNRFYRIAQWCKRLHLPNFAMVTLPDEMYHSCGGQYEVRIGQPIPWQTFDKTRTSTEWVKWVQNKVYQL